MKLRTSKALPFLLLVSVSSTACSEGLGGKLVLYPSSLKSELGTHSTQPIAVLSRPEQSAEQDDWDTYVQLTPDPTGYSGVFTFEVPKKVSPSHVSTMQLDVNFRGPEQGLWTFALRDTKTGHWQTVGNSSFADAWLWSPLHLTVRGNLAGFLDDRHRIELRVESSTDGAIALDFVRLTLGLASPAGANETVEETFLLPPDELLVSTGQVSEPRLPALHVREHKGESEGDGYLEFVPAADGFDGLFTFHLPGDVVTERILGLDVVANFRGLGSDEQRWQFSLREDARRWTPIADNSTALSWVWSELVGAAGEPFSAFVGENGRIELRLQASNALDAALLDQLALRVRWVKSGPMPLPPVEEPFEGEPPAGGPAPPHPPFEPPPGEQPLVADWVRTARLAGLSVQRGDSAEKIQNALEQRLAEGVSVIELDTSLSQYHSDASFELEAQFIDEVTRKAQAMGMRVVVYIPALEVLTKDGATIAETMAKEHPDWLQLGFDGKPNVFYGSKEHWVDATSESAWMSPFSPYRDYFLARMRRLAETALDGVWIDVPVFMDTGAGFPDTHPNAREAFRQWGIDKGFGSLNVPTQVDFEDPVFRHWIQWRHDALADFCEDVRVATQAVNPDFVVAVETYTMDYMDGSWTGLDGTVRRNARNFIRVWEVDSVSNTRAMQWAGVEDFSNKLAMFKWARGADRANPSWVFSYGNEPLDAGLVIGAAIATGNSPFESKTPDMPRSVGSTFRRRWFEFIRDNEAPLLKAERFAQAGIWYSAPTRDFHDLKSGGMYGMYVETEAPSDDPDWWGRNPDDTSLRAPHLGGWRGAAYAFHQLGVSYRVVTDPGNPAQALQGLSFLWLPSVTSFSDESAHILRNFVSSGGFVLATGAVPGTLDETGQSRPQSVVADLFGFDPLTSPGARAHRFGNGAAVFRPDVRGGDFFAEANEDPTRAAQAMDVVERLVRIHAPDETTASTEHGLHLEMSRPSDARHYIYALNYAGLQRPAVSLPRHVFLTYRAPAGLRVKHAWAHTPDAAGTSGGLTIQRIGDGVIRLRPKIDQFTLISLDMEPAPPADDTYRGPVFASPQREEAARSALAFARNMMRPAEGPEPFRFGVFTNLADSNAATGIYAHGHHVTAEHMGLMLRATACMGDRETYDESYRFVRDLMLSPIYRVVNWAVDKDKKRPLVQNFGEPNWVTANAPLDDLRVVRGLLAGPRQAGNSEAGDTGRAVLRGLLQTSVTNRSRTGTRLHQDFPGGLLGYAFDWSEVDDPTLRPPAIATGVGVLQAELIPVDYQELETVALAAQRDPAWRQVLASGTDLLLASEIPEVPGLFFNGRTADGKWTGDFENQDGIQGEHLKMIQVLWIALHLARASTQELVLDEPRRTAARAAAARSLAFLRNFHDSNDRVPEYLTFAGTDVADCASGAPRNCLKRGVDNLFRGEARIYAQLARLALLLNDAPFAARLIDEHILTDRVSDPADSRYGLIGKSTTSAGDAEAWNVLESLLTLCLEAGGE